MARTMKYLERKAMEAYAVFAENPDCFYCPFESFYCGPEWARDLKTRLGRTDSSCTACSHFFEEVKEYKNTNCACPCKRIGAGKALEMLNGYVKKWRKEGLI